MVLDHTELRNWLALPAASYLAGPAGFGSGDRASRPHAVGRIRTSRCAALTGAEIFSAAESKTLAMSV